MSTTPKLLKKGFKFPIYPTSEQQELINQTFGCCRYVWNKALAQSAISLKWEDPRPSGRGVCQNEIKVSLFHNTLKEFNHA